MSGLGKRDNRNFGSLAKPTGRAGVYFQKVNGALFKYTKKERKWAIERIASPLPYLTPGFWGQSGEPVGDAVSLQKCLEKARAA